MDCLGCGRANRAGAKFCEVCGSPLAGACPRCRGPVPAEARFCGACGQRLKPAAVQAQPDRRFFTPAHLAEKVRRERPSEGERRTVTVVFVDAVGSTPLAEKLGEEEMYSLMRECLSRMSEAVHRYEGHVASFTGDGVMALFGAPIAHEDSARRAVAAALRMQRNLDEYAREVNQRHGVECRFRIGLNTGPVVVGTVTDDLRMDFTAIGDTVNLAARMEQVAEPGSVLVSESTHRVIADFFECEPLGALAVKGKAQPVSVYRVLREEAVRTRFEAAAKRGLSPLVGRHRELAVLAGHVERAHEHGGQVVVVCGEAGIGKSRLILELRRRLASESVGWLEGHCVPYGRNSTYLPVVDLLKDTFGIQDGDDGTRIIRRVDEVVVRWSAQAQKRAPYLKYLLSVDPGDDTIVMMDPQERRIETFEALRAVLVEESAHRPLVVVVEDLHWADQMSQQALAALLPVVPSAPVLLVLTHRPGWNPLLVEEVEFVSLALDHLDEEETVALTRYVLGVEALPPEVQRLVTAKAEGNPFYVEEVCKALVETGVVTRADGSYQLQRPIAQIRIPGTIQDVILSRIDRLETGAKRAIQLASVIGREFTARLLDHISDLETRLLQVLAELKTLEFIYEKPFFLELAYMFKHALTQDVAYATLLAERRRGLHRLVGAAIEELYWDRLAEHYEILAQHYFEGQEWEKALDYLDKAGDKAAAAYANQDALAFYARALEVCEALGDKTLGACAAVARKRGFVNFGIGDVPAAIADFERMVDAARRLESRSLEGMALGYRGLMQVWNAEFDVAEATLRMAWAIADAGFEEVRPLASFGLAGLFIKTNRFPEVKPLLIPQGQLPALQDAFLQGSWNWLLGCVYYWWGRPDDALRVLRNMPDAPARVMTNRLFNWWAQALALGTKGDYEAAARLLEDTLSTCERVGDVPVRARALNTVGWIYGELQDPATALKWDQASLETVESHSRFPEPDIAMNARLNIADDLVAALGQLDEAEDQFRLVEAVARGPLPAAWACWRYSQRLFHSYGEFWLNRGDPVRALAYAEECLELAQHNSSTKNVIKGRRLRAQALVVLGRLREAERELCTALEGAIELGNPPQLWKTHAAIGDLRRAQGRSEDAHQAYREALTVIDRVAASLTDQKLRKTFLASGHVQNIIRAALGADE